jgi:hypothetical protein
MDNEQRGYRGVRVFYERGIGVMYTKATMVICILVSGCGTTATRHESPYWEPDTSRRGCGWSDRALPEHHVEDKVILDDGSYMYYQCDVSERAPCVWADVPELSLNGDLYWWDGKNREVHNHEYIMDLWWVCRGSR